MRRLTCLMLTLAVISGCCRKYDRTTGYNSVVLVYSLGYNNLSNSLNENIEDMCSIESLPYGRDGNVLLVYNHSTKSYYNFHTPTEPCLYRIYNDGGKVVRDTLVKYGKESISASAETLNEVLSYIKTEFPSDSYGMVFSSHGTGWLPEGYDINPEDEDEGGGWTFAAREDADPVQSAGMHVIDGKQGYDYYGIDIDDMADCIPLHFKYIVFDACLMGCAEVAYELRNVCDRLVVSPTEVMQQGFRYETMLARLNAFDLTGLAQDFYEKYKSGSCVSVTVVDCSKMENLAKVCKSIISTHREAFKTLDRNAVQRYFYNEKHWFYDLRDTMAKLGASESELESLDAALAECVTFKAWTDTFFTLKLQRVCGLSMYIPIEKCPKLNAFYRELEWNEATGVIN